MTFSDEIAKTNSERFSLVRIQPTRWISSDLVDQGGGLYKYTGFPFPIANVKRTDDNNGLELLDLTEVSVTPTVDDTYQVLSDNSILLKSSTAPETGEDGEFIFYVDYYIFYSSSANGTSFYTDPTTTTGDKQLWEPRITLEPSLTQSSDDTVFGIVKSKASGIRLANQDSDFQKYLTDDNSFYNKDCVVWLVVNGEIKKLFTSKVKSIDLDKNVNIRLYDPTTRLDQTASFGTSRDDTFWSKDIAGGGIANQIDDDFLGKPVPLVIGVSSWHQIVSPTEMDTFTFNPTVPDVPNGDQATMNRGQKAVNLDVRRELISTVYNRTWGICKTFNGIAVNNYTGAIDAVSTSGAGSCEVYFNLASNHTYQIGDTVHWKDSGSDFYGVCTYNKAHTFLGNPYNLAVLVYNNLPPIVSVGSSFQSTYSLSIICRSAMFSDATQWKGSTRGYRPLLEGVDYTVTEVTLDTAAANQFGYKSNVVFAYITLEDNFEANTVSTMSSPFNPNNDSIEWRATAKSLNATHAEMAQEFCQAAGLDVDTASFTAAKAALTCNILFQIPLINETELGSYRQYLGEITKAASTYIYTNNDGKTAYSLLEAPTSGDNVDNDNVIAKSIRRSRIYNDIKPVVFSSNRHTPSFEGRYYVDRSFSSDKFQFLHGSDEQKEFFHVSVTGDAPERTAKILRNRTEIYNFDVGPEFLEKEIGDTITLDVDESGSAKNLFIIGLVKSVDKVRVTARDFGEL